MITKRRFVWTFALGFMIIAGPPAKAENEPTIDMVCQWIANKLASVGLNECLNQELIESESRSVEDIPILYKEYPPLPRREPLARVMLFGGIHGDEYASVSIVFKWMNILNELVAYQQYLIKDRKPQNCFQAFLNNNWFGAVIFCGLFIHYQFGTS